MSELRPWLALIFHRPGRLMVGALLMLLTLVSGIGLLALSGWFITATALAGVLLAAGTQASINLYVPGGGIRFFAVSRTVGRYLERLYNHDTVLRLLSDIRIYLFRGLAAQPLSRHGALQSSRWLSRFTIDVDKLDTLYLRLVAPTSVALLLTAAIGLVAWFAFDLLTGLLVTGLLLSGLLIATVFAWWLTRQQVGQEDERRDELRTRVIEHLDGLAELTAAGRAGRHGARLLRLASRSSRNQASADERSAWASAATQLFLNMAVVASLWTGLGLLQQNQISGPVLVLLPLAIMGLGEVYAALPDTFSRLAATTASAARINRDCPDTSGPALARVIPEGDGEALVIERLHLRHGQHTVLGYFDLTVLQGERVAVTGRSGSGKSSLGEAIAGLLIPAGGQIRNLPLAFLTQRTVILDDTLAANLRLGNGAATDETLWQVLDGVGLAERFQRETAGLATWLGAAGRRLSGGEARRVALARVLLSPAQLIVLDEPFTGVDPQLRCTICKGIEPWLEGKTLIALGHSLDALPRCDRTVPLG